MTQFFTLLDAPELVTGQCTTGFLSSDIASACGQQLDVDPSRIALYELQHVPPGQRMAGTHPVAIHVANSPFTLSAVHITAKRNAELSKHLQSCQQAITQLCEHLTKQQETIATLSTALTARVTSTPMSTAPDPSSDPTGTVASANGREEVPTIHIHLPSPGEQLPPRGIDSRGNIALDSDQMSIANIQTGNTVEALQRAYEDNIRLLREQVAMLRVKLAESERWRIQSQETVATLMSEFDHLVLDLGGVGRDRDRVSGQGLDEQLAIQLNME